MSKYFLDLLFCRSFVMNKRIYVRSTLCFTFKSYSFLGSELDVTKKKKKIDGHEVDDMVENKI